VAVSERDPEHTPILITDAQRSYEDELAVRKRRYGIMMGMRVPCLIVAAMLYNHPLIAAALIVLSIPLPWMAVIIANDRLPRKASGFSRHREEGDAGPGLASGERPAIEAAAPSQPREHRVIDMPDGG
jgi:hypothetical protein